MLWTSSSVKLGQDINASSANWSPTVWLLTAPATIVTTHYLIHDKHQHFPYHLLIPQILVAIAIRLQIRARDHGWRDLFETIRNGCRRLKSPASPHLWSFASTALAITSLFAAYQAFFHLPSVLCEALVLPLAPACASSVYAFWTQPDRFTAARVACLALFVFTVLLHDYRVTPPGFGIALLALGSHIGAHFCNVQSKRTDSPESLDDIDEEDGDLWTLVAAVLPLIGAALFSERPRAMGFDVTMAPVLLPINAIVGGIALANSASLFYRSQPAIEGSDSEPIPVDTPALPGLVLIGYAVAGRGVVISGWQIAAFIAAFLIGSMASTYADAVYSLDDYLRTSYMPTWRRVLGFQEPRFGNGVGLLEEESISADSRLHKGTRCTGKFSAWHVLRATLLIVAAIGWACVFLGALRHALAFHNHDILPHPNEPHPNPTGTFDIVVSYHDESIPKLATTLTSFLQLPNIAPLSQRVLLYAKAPAYPLPELQTNLSLALPNTTTVETYALPNLGREGETFLHHILANYNSSLNSSDDDDDDDAQGLADHTLFLQADMHDPHYMRPRLTQYFHPRTAFLSLWHTETLCASCATCRDHSPWQPNTTALSTVFSAANSGAECADLVPTYRGQFVASARRIRSNEKEVYEGLRERFEGTGEENPAWGYDLERLWGAVLRCPGGRRMADRCPSMRAGMLGVVGEVGDCQCLDD